MTCSFLQLRETGSFCKCILYLEAQGDLVSRITTPRTHIIVTLIIPIIDLLAKSPTLKPKLKL